jgi:hypothetical protein
VEMVLMTDNDMHFSLLNRLDRTITVHSNPSVAESFPAVSVSPFSSPSPVSLQRANLSLRTPATHPTTDDRQLLMLQVKISLDFPNIPLRLLSIRLMFPILQNLGRLIIAGWSH